MLLVGCLSEPREEDREKAIDAVTAPLVRLAAAVLYYEAEHGAWPDNLEDLSVFWSGEIGTWVDRNDAVASVDTALIASMTLGQLPDGGLRVAAIYRPFVEDREREAFNDARTASLRTPYQAEVQELLGEVVVEKTAYGGRYSLHVERARVRFPDGGREVGLTDVGSDGIEHVLVYPLDRGT